MSFLSKNRSFAIAAIVASLCAFPAAAQATRTWVSGVGDDANPCSRTAPCKTFAGAISKTATGGEINVLDPGGFGGVTITKSISIISEKFEAGVLVSGTNGIVVNAPANSVVILKGLDIEGLGTGLNGIRFIGGGSLFVEDCQIHNFAQKGIDFEPSTASATPHRLFVSKTVIRNNANDPNGGGIFIKPGVGASAEATIVGARLERNRFGVRAEDRSQVTVVDTIASGGAGSGFAAISTAGGAVKLTLKRCTANANGGIGIASWGATSDVRISECTVVGNNEGLSTSGGGLLSSLSDNLVYGNTTSDGATNGVILPK